MTESSEPFGSGDIGARGRGALRLWIGVWVVSAALLAGTVAYVHGLERDLAMRESALKASEGEHKRSREEHRLRLAELAQIEAKIVRLATDRTELERSIEALEERFENTKTTIAAAAEAERIRQQRTAEVKGLEKSISERKRRADDLQEELTRLSRSRDDLVAEEGRAQEKLRNTRNELSAVEAELSRNRARGDEIRAENTELAGRREALERELARIGAERSRRQGEADDARNAVAERESRANTLESELTALVERRGQDSQRGNRR